MRGRSEENRLKLWVLLDINRLVLAGTLALAVFAAFVLVVGVLHPPFQSQIRSGDTIETIFSTMISVIVTGATLVVTISQLVLSQENGPLGDQRERMANAMDFRSYTEELIGDPSPADPSAFLRELVDAAEQRTNELAETVKENDDEQLRREVEEFSDSVTGNSQAVREKLEGASFGSFDVVNAALDYNYGWKIFQIERIGTKFEESLDSEENRLFDDLRTSLSLFGPAREHIKTLYFQWELIDLSQMILYAAVPSVTLAGVMTAVVDGGTFPGTLFGLPVVVWVVGAAFAVTLVPFLLFISYVVRILTVAKRTLAIEPLILRESQR